MELSLDDIIKRKKQKQSRVRKGVGVSQKLQMNKNQQLKGITKMKDARNHIILKKRTKITDARDKLAEIAKKGDARQKLEQLRMKRNFKGGNINRPQLGVNLVKNKNGSLSLRTKGRINRGIFTDSTRQVHPSPLILSPNFSRITLTPTRGYPLDVSMDEEYVPAPLKPIIRSINNEVNDYLNLPPLPAFSPLSRMRSQPSFSDNPFMNDKRSGLNFKIVAKNDDVRISPISSSGIMKRNHGMDDAIYLRDTSPTNPVSILKKRQFGGKSVSNLRSRYDPMSTSTTPRLTARQKVSKPPLPQSAGFRIVVSNLRNSVTASDIHELFGDIGKLEESRLVRPGTAEVIYGSLKDAQKAVDVYHNRQLDGQPMKCFLVNPRNPPPGAAQDISKFGSVKPALPASSNSSVIPDISTFHKVLFRKH